MEALWELVAEAEALLEWAAEVKALLGLAVELISFQVQIAELESL